MTTDNPVLSGWLPAGVHMHFPPDPQTHSSKTELLTAPNLPAASSPPCRSCTLQGLTPNPGGGLNTPVPSVPMSSLPQTLPTPVGKRRTHQLLGPLLPRRLGGAHRPPALGAGPLVSRAAHGPVIFPCSHQRAPVSPQPAGQALPAALQGSHIPRGKSPSPPAPTGPCTACPVPSRPSRLFLAPSLLPLQLHRPPRGSQDSQAPSGLRPFAPAAPSA